MLLEHIGKSSYHYLDLSDNIELMYLSSEFKVSEAVLREIINALVKFGEFDKELWEENSILFNEKFIENISDAYKKRNNDCVNKESLVVLLHSKGILKHLKSNPNGNKSKLKEPVKPQSKEEEIKTDKNKEEKINERKLKFASTLEIYLPTYGKEMLNDFYKYWTEPNNSNTKFRKELEKTWSLERRLETWSKNENNFKKEKCSAEKEKPMIGRMTEEVAKNNFNAFLNVGKHE